jgi:Cytochrome P450
LAQKEFPHASLVEGLRFTAQVAVPNVIQGLFRRRRTAVGAATKAGADGLAVSFIGGLLRSYGEGPLWIRVAKDEALLLLGRDAIRHGLEGSPDPFAADPEPKKSAMERFQPDALTISREPEWSDRRRFTEAVLDTDRPVHRLGDRFAAVAVEAAQALPAQLDWDTWNAAVRRVAREVILGPGAADDEELSQMLGELMDKSNPPGRGDSGLLERYTERLQGYVDAGQEGSLVGLFPQAPSTELTRPARQVTHWLFALGDTLAINAFRCLALLAVHDAERARTVDDDAFLGACLQEAMRLWPTTPMLSRVTAHDTEWDGVSVPEGTQLLIVNTFNHRDREAVEFADRFDPEQWLSGEAGGDWQFNHFSHGPQGCPGAGLSLLVGQATLGTVLRERLVRLEQPGLDPDKPLPHMLDFFALKFELSPPA